MPNIFRYRGYTVYYNMCTGEITAAFTNDEDFFKVKSLDNLKKAIDEDIENRKINSFLDKNGL